MNGMWQYTCTCVCVGVYALVFVPLRELMCAQHEWHFFFIGNIRACACVCVGLVRMGTILCFNHLTGDVGQVGM